MSAFPPRCSYLFRRLSPRPLLQASSRLPFDSASLQTTSHQNSDLCSVPYIRTALHCLAATTERATDTNNETLSPRLLLAPVLKYKDLWPSSLTELLMNHDVFHSNSETLPTLLLQLSPFTPIKGQLSSCCCTASSTSHRTPPWKSSRFIQQLSCKSKEERT